MLNHTFTFNGHTSDEFGIKIERFRALSRPGRKYDAASVPGRNGILYKLQEAWEEILVSYEIFAEASVGETEADITKMDGTYFAWSEDGLTVNGTVPAPYEIEEAAELIAYRNRTIVVQGGETGVWELVCRVVDDYGTTTRTATITNGSETFILSTGDYLYIDLKIYAGTYTNEVIPLKVIDGEILDLPKKWTDIMEWLHSADEYAELTDTYDPEHYYEAVFVDGTEIANSWNKYGRAVVSFRCRPERFLSAYKRIILDLTDTQPITGYATAQINMYQQPSTSNPVMYQLPADTSFFVEYTGTGGTTPEGVSKIIRKEPDATSEYIGSIGDGEKGFLILGQEANNWYHVYYADMYQGKQRGYIIGYISPSDVTNDGVTWYKVKIEGYPDGFIRSTNTVIDNTIIFNNPTEHTARPKITLVASNTTGSIKVNGIKLSSSRAFDELYIDCDNENVTGFNDSDYGIIKPYNANLSLVNNIGKPSAEFISLRPGDNYIVVSSSVGWVELDTRFWEI